MKKQSFIVGAVILTLGGIIAKVIGAFYKIPLTNILGSSGMGIYYLIFPLYSIMLVLSSNGISLALSKLVAGERVNKNKRNETTYFQMAILITFAISFLCAVVLVVFCKNISTIQGNSNSTLGYIAIAPALVCASMVAVIKGYFQGIENMIPSSIAMIFEQIVKLIIGLILSGAWLYRGVEYAVLGAICGVTISELITLFVMVFNYVWYKSKEDYKFFMREKSGEVVQIEWKTKCVSHKAYLRHYPKKRRRYRQKLKIMYFYNDKEYLSKSTAFKNLIRFSLPSTLSSLIMPFISLVDSFVIINLFEKMGITSITATSLYGLSNGVVSSLVSLPIIFTVAFSTAVMPNVSSLSTNDSVDELENRSAFFIKITWIIALLLFVGFIVFSKDIINILYGKGLSEKVIDEYTFSNRLLIVGSSTIIYNCLLSTLIALLNGLNKPQIPTIAMGVGAIVRFVVCYTLVLVPKINIFSVYISNAIFMFVACLICAVELNKYINLSINVRRGIIYPLIVSLLSGGVGVGVGIALQSANIYLKLVVGVLAVVITYFGGILLFGVFGAREKSYFPSIRIKKLFGKTKK